MGRIRGWWNDLRDRLDPCRAIPGLDDDPRELRMQEPWRFKEQEKGDL